MTQTRTAYGGGERKRGDEKQTGKCKKRRVTECREEGDAETEKEGDHEKKKKKGASRRFRLPFFFRSDLFIEQSLVCTWKDFGVELNLYQIVN